MGNIPEFYQNWHDWCLEGDCPPDWSVVPDRETLGGLKGSSLSIYWHFGKAVKPIEYNFTFTTTISEIAKGTLLSPITIRKHMAALAESGHISTKETGEKKDGARLLEITLLPYSKREGQPHA